MRTVLKRAALAAAVVMMVATPAQAQAPTPPVGVTERDIIVPGPVPLPGTLTLPSGKGPFPVVVLVHGSGAGDRDLTMGAGVAQVKPYRDIAWGLATRGVAVLRYDKRAKVKPFWYFGRAFTVKDETIDDAVSALQLARQQPEIDPSRSFFIGHSLGGMLAPRIALADGHVAGVIIMAGATREKLQDALPRQIEYMISLGGADTSALRAQLAQFQPFLNAIRRVTPADSAKTQNLLGAPASYYLDMNAYDPAVVMHQVTGPVLVLQGMRDYQVTPEGLEDWLKAVGPRKEMTVKRYAALNHLFIAGEGAPNPSEYAKGGHVSAEMIGDVAKWIKERKAVRPRD
ncbi:MAG: alpha/beta fold hydrolase [Gemmatimonadetes bacterium]|nr:alpha/beta fold hydrolase [Gemmatimonadota bacterium]